MTKKQAPILLALLLLLGCMGTQETTNSTTVTTTYTKTVRVQETPGQEYDYKITYQLVQLGMGAKIDQMSKGRFTEKEEQTDAAEYVAILQIKNSATSQTLVTETYKTSQEGQHYFLFNMPEEPENIQIRIHIITPSSDRHERLVKICTKNQETYQYECH